MPTPRTRLLARLTIGACALALAAVLTTMLPDTGHPPERIAAATPDRVDPARPSNPSTVINATAIPDLSALAPPTPAPDPQPAPKPKPSPAPRVVPVSHGSGDVDAAIAAHFGPIADQATRVADCESSLNPAAVSPGGGNWGLFQINRVHADDFEQVTGHPWSDVLDADLNAMYARHLYDDQGWDPWACRWAASR